MSNPHNIKPGDELIAVRHDGTIYVRNWTVLRVGRKWAVMDCRRVNLETLEIDGGDYSSPGRCYLSQEHYEQENRRRRAWNELRYRVNDSGKPPSHLTTEAIERVLGELRGK